MTVLDRAPLTRGAGTPGGAEPKSPAGRHRFDGWRRRERRLAGTIGFVALIPFVLFALVPVAYVVVLSFMRYNGVGDPTWVGIHNYALAFADSSWWSSVTNTLVLAGGSIIIELPLALLLAVLLNRALRWTSGFRTVFFLPHIVSIAVMGVVFFFILRPVDGILNGILRGMGVLSADVDWLGSGPTAMLSLILVSVWSGFGINTIFFLVGLQTIPRDVYESASLDGASGWQQFRAITLPMLTPVMRIVVMLSIVFSLRSFDLVKTLTNGGPAGQTDVMFTYLFEYFFSLQRGSQYGYASALAVIASVIIAIVSIIYLAMSRANEQRSGFGDARRRRREERNAR